MRDVDPGYLKKMHYCVRLGKILVIYVNNTEV